MTYVLVVEDDPEINALMTLMLRVENYEVEQARDGRQALQMVSQRTPDLILLDVMMPRLSGYEVARILQQSEATKHIPLIFVTAKSDTQDLVRGLEMAIDYVCKPFSSPELIARVRAALRMSTLQEQLRASNEQLAQLATTDALTGLCNRRHFYVELEDEMQRARRFGQPISVVMFDLDHFKKINDVWGHAQGDLVLQAFSRVLESTKRSIDAVARLGGEEFVALLPATGFDGALAFAEKVRLATEQVRISNLSLEGKDAADLRVTVSVGVAVATRLAASESSGNDADAELRDATEQEPETELISETTRDETGNPSSEASQQVAPSERTDGDGRATQITSDRAHELQYADDNLSADSRLFLQAADRLLYQSKAAGRNRITAGIVIDEASASANLSSPDDNVPISEIARL